MSLTTNYMGLDLRSPVIVGSSGLTQSVDGVVRCAEAGAGAVVLKSIFEEQIDSEVGKLVDSNESSAWHPEAEEYITRFGREEAVDGYLQLIRDARAAAPIPVIASVHCVSAGGWVDFAERAERAGAAAIELNLFVTPSDPRRDGRANERVYFDIARAVRRRVSIPVALKIGSYFSGLSHTAIELSRIVDGLVLFNRFSRFDFDIENLSVVPSYMFSNPEEIAVPLRWISILSGQVSCDLAATTGVDDGEGVVKHLLAGASAVQVCSALYRRSDIGYLRTMLEEVGDWMGRHGYTSIAEFRGKLSQSESANPAAYERVQFMMGNVAAEPRS